MMIAEVTSAPVDIAAWLGCLAFLVILVNGVLKLTDRSKAKPEPTLTYSTKTELNKVEADLKLEIEKVDTDVASLRKEIVSNGEVRRQSIEAKVQTVKDELHNKFTTLHGEVSSAKTSIKAIDTQLTHILAVVDQINSGAKGDRKERREH